MISAGDFRNGVTIEIEGNVCQIVEFQHVKPGKGAAFVRTKYKNIITGAVLGIGGRTGFVQFLRGRKAVLLIGGNGSCHLL